MSESKPDSIINDIESKIDDKTGLPDDCTENVKVDFAEPKIDNKEKNVDEKVLEIKGKEERPAETSKKSGVKEKLKRLEEKYVETLKQQAALQATIERSSVGFNDVCVELEIKNQSDSIDEIISSILNAIKSMKKKHKDEVDKIKQQRFESDNKIVELQSIVNRLQTNNSDLLVVLKHKESDIIDLKRINESLKKDSTDPILQRFNSINSPVIQQRTNKEKDDEISQLKYELDQVYNRLDEAEEQIASNAKKPLTNKKDIQIQVNFNSDTSKSILKPHNPASYDPNSRAPSTQKEAEEEIQSKIYLKNLIIRYMVYEAKRNDAECSVIRRAILDCVGVNGEDRATVDDAVNNKGGIKDAVYFLKSFGGMS